MKFIDTLTRRDVRSFYRLFLGREPEADDVIDAHVSRSRTTTAFLAEVLGDPEVLRRTLPLLPRQIASPLPQMDAATVEVDCDPCDLRRLFAQDQRLWADAAAPDYSVLSARGYLAEAQDDALTGFRESGQAEVSALLQRLQLLGAEPCFAGTAVELGCGAGRVTRPLAGRFARIVGYDTSERHLDLAAAYLDHPDSEAVALVPMDSLSDFTVESHTFFYAGTSLQRHPPPVIDHLLRSVFRSTAPGGIVVFQLPTQIRGYRFSVADALQSAPDARGAVHALPQERVFAAMTDGAITPVEVYRDAAAGFEGISTVFIGRKGFRRS